MGAKLFLMSLEIMSVSFSRAFPMMIMSRYVEGGTLPRGLQLSSSAPRAGCCCWVHQENMSGGRRPRKPRDHHTHAGDELLPSGTEEATGACGGVVRAS